MLWRSHPAEAEQFLNASQQEVTSRYHHYQQLAALNDGVADKKKE